MVAPRSARLELAAVPMASSEARRATRTHLQEWDVPTSVVDDALLVVSELVTNAVRHAADESNTLELELAQTGQLGYRVQAGPQTGAHTVAAGGPYKAGKAIVVGDASAFSDDDTDGDQIPNAAEAENLRFVERLLDW